MATTPGTRRREARTGAGDDRDLIDPTQEPLGSTERPLPRGSDIDDLNLAHSEAVRRPGDPDLAAMPRSVAGRSSGSATSIFAIVAVILVAAFLVALYLGSNRSNVATGVGTTQAPIADSTGGSATGTDTTGSTTTPPPPPESAPASGNANAPASGTTTPPANP
ncbi:MAG: hypothetical protein U1E16_12960 [Hyphomicrobiales bacterium]